MIYYQTPESTIYRRVENELVVVQLDSGRYFYFNPETEALLNFFRSPGSIESYCKGAAATEVIDEKKKQHLEEFCRFLVRKDILRIAPKPAQETAANAEFNAHPDFLREGEKTLDQISFGCP